MYLGRVARDVRRNRDQRHSDEDHQAGLFEVLAAPRKSEHEHRDADAEPDGGHVIQQQMKMCGIHNSIYYGRRRTGSMLSREEGRGLD